jgi:hypothetical protein
MTNGMSPRIRHIVSSLTAVVTAAMLLSAGIEVTGPGRPMEPGVSESAYALAATGNGWSARRQA